MYSFTNSIVSLFLSLHQIAKRFAFHRILELAGQLPNCKYEVGSHWLGSKAIGSSIQ